MLVSTKGRGSSSELSLWLSAAKCTTASCSAKSSSTSAGVADVALHEAEAVGRAARRAMREVAGVGERVERRSTRVIGSSSSTWRTKLEPMKPAPPVTRIFMPWYRSCVVGDLANSTDAAIARLLRVQIRELSIPDAYEITPDSSSRRSRCLPRVVPVRSCSSEAVGHPLDLRQANPRSRGAASCAASTSPTSRPGQAKYVTAAQRCGARLRHRHPRRFADLRHSGTPCSSTTSTAARSTSPRASATASSRSTDDATVSYLVTRRLQPRARARHQPARPRHRAASSPRRPATLAALAEGRRGADPRRGAERGLLPDLGRGCAPTTRHSTTE